jgi:hypothetical protein
MLKTIGIVAVAALATREERGQRVAGRQRCELFHAPTE